MGACKRLLVGIAAVGVALVAVTADTAAAAAPRTPAPAGSTGYDVSYPQCGAALPSDGGFGIVGVTNGLPWSANPCLKSEYSWSTGRPYASGVYMNTANPGPISSHWTLPGPAVCTDYSSYTDPGCAYNYGWNAANQAYGTATSATASASTSVWWWLDVETGNSWNGDGRSNAADIQGSIDYLRGQGVAGIGIYSTSYQWSSITGGYVVPAPSTGPLVADWVAGAGSLSQASSWCGPGFSFSGGPVQLVQYPAGSFDGNYVCQTAPSAGPPVADFTVSTSPASQTVAPGASTSYAVTVAPAGGFSGSVNLGVSGLPSGTTAAFSPNPVTASSSTTSSLTVSAGTALAGTFPLKITGTSGALSHSASVTLTISASPSTPDFAMTASPSSRNVTAGSSPSFALSIARTGGFSGAVSLSIGGLPSNVTASFSPSQASTSSTLTVKTASKARPGTYVLTVTGKNGNTSHTITVSLVIAGSNDCNTC
jgi:hypothetical protein